MLTPEQEKKVEVAHERFRWAAKEAERLFDMPIVVRYSGGKDSDAILQLAKESGVPFRVTHNLTTADPPDNVYYIRRVFARLREEGIDCRINVPKRSLWRIMRETLVVPSRLMRVCCSELKERRMPDAPYIVTGVRWAESAGRRAKSGIAMVYTASAPPPSSPRYTAGEQAAAAAGLLTTDDASSRRLFEQCAMRGVRVLNPIIDWSDDDVRSYLRSRGIEGNPLYKEGWTRIGCVGCPLAGRRAREIAFARYPKLYKAWADAIAYIIARRKEMGDPLYLLGRPVESMADVLDAWSGKPLREDG
jgi:phosphoadenosine phosphosulfate reductase|nr:MAG TPA_asm: phosphoadenosine-phosphosulfate reductase [Caudoviricetes sp.]